MFKKFLVFVLVSASIIIPGVVFAGNSLSAVSISAVSLGQGEGRTAEDYVEIYNSGLTTFNLKGHRLVKRTATSTTDTLIKSWSEDTIIPPGGYYLWANPAYTMVKPDISTTGTLSENNGLALRLGASDTGEIVSALMWGSASNGLAQSAVANPKTGEALVLGSTGYSSQNYTPHNTSYIATVALPTPAVEQNVQAVDQSILSTDPALAIPTEQTSAPVEIPPTPPEVAPVPEEIVIAPTSEQVTATSVANPVEVVQSTLPANITVTELLPNPAGADAGFEWVELHNEGEKDANLNGWMLDDIGALPLSDNKLVLGSLVIKPGEYLRVYLPQGKFSLNNTGGDAVSLLNPTSQLIGTVVYTEDVKEDVSWAQVDDKWAWGVPTPGEKNIRLPTVQKEEKPVVEFDRLDISFSEVFPYPVSGEEFVELYNLGSGGNLDGYFLKLGNKKKELKGLKVKRNGFVVISSEYFSSALSNQGKTLQLINPDGDILDEVAYPVAEQGSAYALVDDEWLWTSAITPGKVNEFLPSEPKIEKKASTAKAQARAVGKSAKAKKSKRVKTEPESTAEAVFPVKTALAAPATFTSTGKKSSNLNWIFLAITSIGGGMVALWKMRAKVTLG